MKRYCIGLDVGGSKTKGYGGYEESELLSYQGPGANPSRIGFEESLNIARQAVRSLLPKTLEDLEEVEITLGMAGIEGSQKIPLMEMQLTNFVQELQPNCTCRARCMTDIYLIGEVDLGMEGGLCIILGTGSSFIFRDKKGEFHQGGGWGYLLGDEGSGFGISRRAIQYTMESLDGECLDPFCESLLASIGANSRPDLVNYTYQQTDQIQHLVRHVIEGANSGNTAAKQIIKDELEKLVSRILSFAKNRSLEFSPKIVLNGGLSSKEQIHSILKEIIGRRFPLNPSIQVSTIEPALGAWRVCNR